MSKEINQSDAIKILIKAAQIAQKKGVFNLEEAATIHQAVSAFVIRQESQNNLTSNIESQPVNDTSTVTES